MKKWGDTSPPPVCRAVVLTGTCAYLRPADHAVLIYRDLMMCHARSFVQIREMGVLYAIFQRRCTFFIWTVAYVVLVIRWWFRHYWTKRVHSGIRYSMSDGFGRWNGLQLCITYNAPDRTTHAPVLAYFECHAETMQYTQMKGCADNPMTQIANIDTNQ